MVRIGKLKRWRPIPCEDSDAAERLQKELNVSPVAARLLVNRGLAEPQIAHRFLFPSYNHLPDPMLLPDAAAAIERIVKALNDKERIYVHGDYDVDGVTSAALWFRLLSRLGADVMVHIPHRREGYDMRSEFVHKAKAEGTKLILTCDCGIQRCEEVELARQLGIDVIITDHHEPGAELPRAVAVVNPHRSDSIYPFPELCGVGVAFRLGEALCIRLNLPVDSYRRAYSDLAAIGTVADMMPLQEDNRIFVKYGLESLSQTKKPGLQALIRSAGLTDRVMDADSIGFRLAPRINAIGRVDDSKLALKLLLTTDLSEAAALAERMECANIERRQEEDRILQEALAMIAKGDFKDSHCIVVAGENWNAGVIGIVAGRIKERTGRPTILLSIDSETGNMGGSARSIGSFNIKQALDACSDYLGEYGGHAQAAGLSLASDNYQALVQQINQLAREQIDESDLEPCIDVEIEIDPQEITATMMRELKMFEPWGRGNHHPLFVSRNIQIADTRRMGKESQHLKLRCEYDGFAVPDSIQWNAGDLADHLNAGDHIDLCYKPQLNTWNGSTSIQFLLEDLRPSDSDEW